MDTFIGLVFFVLIAGGIWYYVKSRSPSGKGGKSSGGKGNVKQK